MAGYNPGGFKIDKKKIDSVMQDFYNVTGLSIGLVDLDFNYLTRYPNEADLNPYCRYVHENGGRLSCDNFDNELFEKCMKSLSVERSLCGAS